MIKHIIIVNDFGHINGGAGKVALTTAATLAEKGYNVTLLCAVPPIDKKLLKNVNIVCLNQHDILSDPSRIRAMTQGLWNSRARKTLAQLLEKLPASETVVHFHGWTKALSASLFQVTAMHKANVVITLHDFFTICPNGGLFNYKKLKICRLKPASIQCLCCNCDARNYPQKIFRTLRHIIQTHWLKKNSHISVCAISQLDERLLRPNIKWAKKWFFLQNPVELNNKTLVKVGKNNTYLFMARLSKEKGCELFCKAITELHLKGCVLGNGYLKDELQQKYPNIEFTGWVDGEEKENLLKQCKALVFTSLWYETYGLVVAEMKSYGIPCIVPDESAAAEQVDDGKTGLIFKTGNINSLKQAIMKYEKSDPTTFQKNITASFNPVEFSKETYLTNLLKIYNEVIDARQNPA